MAGYQVHLSADLLGMALFMVLGLLPGILEPLDAVLLPSLLRVPLQLLPGILQTLPPLARTKVCILPRSLLQPHESLLSDRGGEYQQRCIQENLLEA